MAVLGQTRQPDADTGELVALSRPTRVRLRVWGFTRDDCARAELMARHMPGASFWEITEVLPSSGGACPIPADDPIALKQGADYDRAWAVYLAVGSGAG